MQEKVAGGLIFLMMHKFSLKALFSITRVCKWGTLKNLSSSKSESCVQDAVELRNVYGLVRYLWKWDNMITLMLAVLPETYAKRRYSITCFPCLSFTLFKIIFQQFGAPPHYAILVGKFVDKKLWNKRMGMGGSIPWSVRCTHFISISRLPLAFFWIPCIT